MIATGFFRKSYAHILKPILFKFDPEKIHDLFVMMGEWFGRHRFSRNMTAKFFKYSHPMLNQNIYGINFPNPVGLAGGFDKDARLTQILPSVGFGYEEVGSITGEPCAGNSGKRLWRLQESKSIRVHYGLKNEGCEKIALRLSTQRFQFPIGINIAKTNCAETSDDEAGIKDYAKAFEVCTNLGDYFTVNISCPNAFGGQPFTDPDKLDALMTRLDKINTEKPVFLKLSADLTHEQIDEIVKICEKHRIHGFVVSNLTKLEGNDSIKQDEIEEGSQGGFSGKPTAELSNRIIAHIYKNWGDKYVIIGCGGIFSAIDAYEKIRQGATLVQLITSMIFEGPQLIGEINQDLVELLKRDGYSSISEAIGAAHR